MDTKTFNDLAEIYEALIDWNKRLGHEEGFFRSLFTQLQAKSVLDSACGTGRHAALFNSWGLEVEGADISPEMLRIAERQFGRRPGLRWALRGFQEPAPDTFDVVTCVGNSLALAQDSGTFEQALRHLVKAARPGGAVVLQVLNLWHLPDGPLVWQKQVQASISSSEVLILKGVHRSGSRGFVDLLVIKLPSGSVLHRESVPFLGIDVYELTQQLHSCGVSEITVNGGYHGEPYLREQSIDLIAVART